MSISQKTWAPNLTTHLPRSFKYQLGGYVLLPRMLDKDRATIACTNGEFVYNSNLDKSLIQFIGFDPDELKKELASGKDDEQILEWLDSVSLHKRTPWEIEHWSSFMLSVTHDSTEKGIELFRERVTQISRTRGDIKTWADYFDADDYATFWAPKE